METARYNCFSQQAQKETFAVKMKVENVFHKTTRKLI